MAYERMANGVLERTDGKGDPWSNAHRDALGRPFYMADIDGYFGFVAFAGNTGEKLFLEYEPDSIGNKDSTMRHFAIVAMFDRKSSEGAAFSGKNSLGSNFYRFICRTFASFQPVGPRFFFVIGGDVPPWTMIELNLRSGREIGRCILSGSNWSEVWIATGLARERDVLQRWIRSEPSETP